MQHNQSLLTQLGRAIDPVLFHPLADLATLLEVRERPSGVTVVVAEPVEEYPAPAELRTRLASLLDGGRDVELELRTLDLEEIKRLGARLRELEGPALGAPTSPSGVRPNRFAQRGASTRVLAIASGKGGVGKSTVTVNLAVALARAGHDVGILDADVYGFSVPRMLGVAYPPVILDKVIVPPVGYSVRCISMGLFVDEDKPVAWRGPMLHKALEQFLVDVHWGPLDYLLVDLPPGTGDVALSVAEQLPAAELYVVTTPQPASDRIAQRAGALARQLRLPLRGVIENMSYLLTPDGARLEVFGSGGGTRLAESLNAPLLAQIPLDIAVRAGADEGVPAAIAAPASLTTAAFDDLARAVAQAGPGRIYKRELSVS